MADITVHIENTEHGSILVHDRNNDLRSCRRTARYVSREGIDIWDYHCLARAIRVAAHTLVKIVAGACERTLKGTQH